MFYYSFDQYKEMLRHLKDTHAYSQKKVTKLRAKLLSKINDVAVAEREKAVEKSMLNVAYKPDNIISGRVDE